MPSISATFRGSVPALIGLAGLLLLAPAARAGTGNYLIITAQDYAGSAPLTQFVNHKTALGFTVSVYTVAPGTSRTAIKAYILSLWGTPSAPQYILIVGDTDGANATTTTIPHWTGGGSKAAPTDLPYGCMDPGDDWYPDICVGRFSVRTVTTLQAVVDKTIAVESGNFPDPDYPKRAAFLATDDSSAQAEQTHDWVIENYLVPAGYEGIRIYAAQGGGTAQVTAAVNQGCMFVNYFGHSSGSGWWSPSFNQNNVNALSNAGMYGLVFGFSCNTADYSQSECFGETWLRAPNKGAAAYISATTFIYYGGTAWESSRRLETDFWTSFFVDNIWEVGPAWRAGLSRFIFDLHFDNDVKRNMAEMFMLLGDPALRLPRYVASPNPRVDVLSPEGGELLDIGQLWDIRWNAWDDVAVTTVDILLSKDGGATFPIVVATGLANTGTYPWTVPSGATEHGRIKVIAHDADGNLGEDSSRSDFVTAPAPQVVYSFPLDVNPGWTVEGQWAFGQPTGGGTHGRDPVGGHTGANVYGYNLNGDYTNNMPKTTLTTSALDLHAVTQSRLRFWRWLGVERFDRATLEVSNDGTSWTALWTNPAETPTAETAWSQQVYDISAVADSHDTVYVRWGMGPTDASTTYPGWNIDDVEIWGRAAEPALVGDLNCDGVVNFGDINPFVLALTGQSAYEAAYPHCLWLNGDVDGDGHVSFGDINPFVALLNPGG